MSASVAVICRIGSLEKKEGEAHQEELVICRIGSLEIAFFVVAAHVAVICRIGSLEKGSAREC